jgi:hypothetical protein
MACPDRLAGEVKTAGVTEERQELMIFATMLPKGGLNQAPPLNWHMAALKGP